MKIYHTESFKKNDAFTEYLGADRKAAIEAGNTAWQSLSSYDKKITVIEVQEWNLPDDIDATDSDAVYDAMLEALDYDIVTSFEHKEKKS